MLSYFVESSPSESHTVVSLRLKLVLSSSGSLPVNELIALCLSVYSNDIHLTFNSSFCSSKLFNSQEFSPYMEWLHSGDSQLLCSQKPHLFCKKKIDFLEDSKKSSILLINNTLSVPELLFKILLFF